MKNIFLILSIMLTSVLIANESDWSDDESWSSLEQTKEEISNRTFEETKIKNRSKKIYDDKVYKYITGDYNVANNQIELATVHLNDKLQNENVEVNVLVDNLNVKGNSYKDSLDIKRNKYKNFIQHDEKRNTFFNDKEDNTDNVYTEIISHDSKYKKVQDTSISELEILDLRDRNNLKEVSVFIENVDILTK